MKRFIVTIIVVFVGMFFLLLTSQRCFAELSDDIGTQNNELRGEIRSILDDPRFQQTDYSKSIKQFVQKISSFFQFFQSKDKPKFSLDLDTILKKISFGLTLFLPFLLVYWLSRFGSRNFTLRRPTPERIKSTNRHDSLEKARNLAEEGEYREAVRYLYLETLSLLRDEKLISEELQQSDYDHLRALRHKLGGSHPLCHTFQILLQLFQEKWYGMRPCTQENYLRAYDLFCAIVQNSGGYHEIN